MLSEPILVVATLVRTFDALGISYLVGGSVASSVYGIPRATQDVDLVADIRPYVCSNAYIYTRKGKDLRAFDPAGPNAVGPRQVLRQHLPLDEVEE